MLLDKDLRDYILESCLYPSALNVCNRGKGGANVYNILSFHFVSFCPRSFKQGQPERVQATKAQINLLGSQLFLMKSLYSYQHTVDGSADSHIQSHLPLRMKLLKLSFCCDLLRCWNWKLCASSFFIYTNLHAPDRRRKCHR